ncbi:STM4015 family protein [Nonomuraea sp. NN258]|uniref:STM4015 family protein n=1 Tax=Nonomuraea antri TaxID=2730852 RepID=UPI001569BD53|nr:STM4015 family protein [Nonomuraea antri]NRQ35673.1 STM4015 family protein [Nonomuraea antri]
MIKYHKSNHYQHDYRDEYAGLPVARVLDTTEQIPLPAADAAAWRLAGSWEQGEFDGLHLSLKWLSERVDTTRVRALVIGLCLDELGSQGWTVAGYLAERAAMFPELRSLFIGAITDHEFQISFIEHGDVTPVLTAFPKLERLDVRGGTFELDPVRHDSLKTLRLESGGLPPEVVRAVAASDLPALEHLDLWLGTPEYGGETTAADLEPILTGARLPALRHLGLENSDIQDEIAAAVATAPVVARLESLSLALGALGDPGAEALLTGQPLTHLRELDLQHHFLSPEMVARLTRALPGVRLDLSRRAQAERYIAVAE